MEWQNNNVLTDLKWFITPPIWDWFISKNDNCPLIDSCAPPYHENIYPNGRCKLKATERMSEIWWSSIDWKYSYPFVSFILSDLGIWPTTNPLAIDHLGGLVDFLATLGMRLLLQHEHASKLSPSRYDLGDNSKPWRSWISYCFTSVGFNEVTKCFSYVATPNLCLFNSIRSLLNWWIVSVPLMFRSQATHTDAWCLPLFLQVRVTTCLLSSQVHQLI